MNLLTLSIRQCNATKVCRQIKSIVNSISGIDFSFKMVHVDPVAEAAAIA